MGTYGTEEEGALGRPAGIPRRPKEKRGLERVSCQGPRQGGRCVSMQWEVSRDGRLHSDMSREG